MATREELLALAERLGQLGNDMMWVGDQVVTRAAHTKWHCAKAERYRAVMSARRMETRRLANEIWFLAYWAKLQANAQPETTQS